MEPTTNPANPGQGNRLTAAFADGEKTWTEEADLVDLAAEILEQHGHDTEHHGSWLRHADTGLVIQPLLVSYQPVHKQGVRTTTTVEVSHPQAFPAGLFEYQHSAGRDLNESIRKGFDQWARLDLVTLLDALKPKPETCLVLEMRFGSDDDALARRAVLGPVAHYAVNPPPAEPGDEAHPPFCGCCLLTNCFEPFQGLMRADAFYGVRLFAALDENGQPQADCRVNGEDFEAGAEALRRYATTWPPAGYEFRKQYVVLQTAAPTAT